MTVELTVTEALEQTGHPFTAPFLLRLLHRGIVQGHQVGNSRLCLVNMESLRGYIASDRRPGIAKERPSTAVARVAVNA